MSSIIIDGKYATGICCRYCGEPLIKDGVMSKCRIGSDSNYHLDCKDKAK